MQQEDPQPLNYAKPEPTGPSAGKVLGTTLGIMLALPLGLVLGLAISLGAFSFLTAVLGAKGIAAVIYFVGVAGTVVLGFWLSSKSGGIGRMFLATFLIGVVIATLVLCACGFRG